MSNLYIRSAAQAPKRMFVSALGLAIVSTGSSLSAGATVDAGTMSIETPDTTNKDGKGREHQLDTVDVQGTAFTSESSSPKYTAPLRDTPQTINIVPQKVIVEQNLLSLRDVLSTLPGITFGAGEGGGGFGDSINLRGFSANNDIQIDGVRDSAQYSRSDTFNLEQIEVVNGASSVYSGSGSVGGTINLVSKIAQEGSFTNLAGALGTDSYARITADSNQMIGDGTAVRLNLMGHRNDAPGRDVEEFRRWGFAPSITFGIGTDSKVSLSYLHQKDDNIPQYGVPFYNGVPVPGVDPLTYYGYRNVDTQEIEVDAFTAVVSHTFNEHFSMRNFSRIQEVDQFTIVDAPQGTYCLPGNVTPTGTSCTLTPGTATQIVVPVGSYMPSGNRGTVRDTINRMIVNQTDFTVNFHSGAVEHTIVNGFSFMHETFRFDGSNEYRNPDGSSPFVAPNHFPFMNIANPDNFYSGPRTRTRTGKSDGDLDNAALYSFDTLKFSDQWSLNLGARYERNEGSNTLYTVSTTAGAAGPIGTVSGAGIPAESSDDLFSYRAGLVFKPVEAGSIYLAYGNSKTPSKVSVNGTCTLAALPGMPAAANNCDVDPESAVSLELGTKWDLFEQRLSLTASIFRNDRENYKVADLGNPENPSQEQQLDGRARVDGVMLAASGKLSDNWAVYANYAYLDSKVVQGASNFVSSQGQDFTKGDDLLNVPVHSLSLWSTYDWNRWQFGYGASYQGEYFLTQHSATNVSGPLIKADGYWTHRAMIAYNVNHDLRLQLNANNVFNKEYYTRVRNNGWATPGDTRQVILSATYSF
ncbi:MAG: TonB-dependent siderophore receptor [Tahibacter sp.]